MTTLQPIDDEEHRAKEHFDRYSKLVAAACAGQIEDSEAQRELLDIEISTGLSLTQACAILARRLNAH